MRMICAGGWSLDNSSACGSPVNVNDVTQAARLVHGKEKHT